MLPSVLRPNATDHVPVLADEVRRLLDVQPGETVIDATFGAGGYSRSILAVSGTQVIGIDRDRSAIAAGFDLVDRSDGRLVLEEVRRLGHSISDLKRIVLTHAHRSHLGGLAELKRQSGATVYSHEWEADIIAGERKAQAVTILPRRPLRAYIPFQVGLALGFEPKQLGRLQRFWYASEVDLAMGDDKY